MTIAIKLALSSTIMYFVMMALDKPVRESLSSYAHGVYAIIGVTSLLVAVLSTIAAIWGL